MRKIFPKQATINSTLLQNRFILYFIFALTIGNICLFVAKNDIMSVGLLFVTGFLTSFFSKNMIVIMVVALVVSNVYALGNKRRDGFQSFESALTEAFEEAVEEIQYETGMTEGCDEDEKETDDNGNRCCPSDIVDGVCKNETPDDEVGGDEDEDENEDEDEDEDEQEQDGDERYRKRMGRGMRMGRGRMGRRRMGV